MDFAVESDRTTLAVERRNISSDLSISAVLASPDANTELGTLKE